MLKEIISIFMASSFCKKNKDAIMKSIHSGLYSSRIEANTADIFDYVAAFIEIDKYHLPRFIDITGSNINKPKLDKIEHNYELLVKSIELLADKSNVIRDTVTGKAVQYSFLLGMKSKMKVIENQLSNMKK